MEKLENAVVDLRRLQLLNDRICQTLDALNQVKMSSNIGYGSQSLGGGFQMPLPINTGFNHTGYNPAAACNPYFSGYAGAQVPGIDPRFIGTPGFSHTTGINPYFTGVSPVVNGVMDPRFIPGAGFSHTSSYGLPVDPRIANDLWLQERARWNTVPYGYNTNGYCW